MYVQEKFENKNGFIQVPKKTFEEMMERIEEHSDRRALRKSLDEIEEYYPMELVEKILSGANPVREFRKYRGLTQAQLAEKVEATQAYISDIEKGTKDGKRFG